MTVVQEPVEAPGLVGRDLLPPDILADLLQRFSPWRVEYIARVLTPGELRVIADPSDSLIIARIKRMPFDRLRRFDQLIPRDGDHHEYHKLQMGWLRDEEYLLGTRLGRSPTHREFLGDFMNCQNGVRFRAYFALKFPRKVKDKRRASALLP